MSPTRKDSGDESRPSARIHVSPGDSYNIVCVGLDPSSLAVAVALAESGSKAKALFIERKPEFSWEPASVLPEKLVASSFICDLITLRNPRSEYSLTNFLQTTGQLVDFTNASRIEPSRRLMGSYLRWVAARLERLGWIQYATNVVSISPTVAGAASKRTAATTWAIRTRRSAHSSSEYDTKDSGSAVLQAKLLLLSSSAAALPRIPTVLDQQLLKFSGRMLHSSVCGDILATLHRPHERAKVAIVGDNQEAADIFEFCHDAPGIASASLFASTSTLRPEEKHPFADDLANKSAYGASLPGREIPPEVRRSRILDEDLSPRISLPTIESIYALQYRQHILQSDPTQHKCHLHFQTTIHSAEVSSDKILLQIRRNAGRAGALPNTLDEPFDIVIAATGYEPASRNPLLTSALSSMIDGHALTVDADYHVNLRHGALEPDCGLWVLSPLDAAQARQDDFTHVAERAARVLQSVQRRLALSERSELPSGHLAVL